MRKTSLIIFAVLTLSGCAATQPSNIPLSFHKFTAPLGVEHTVETGGSIFVEGEFIDGETITIPESLDLMIPGAMFIPFPVHVAKGTLEMKRISGGDKYYCGDLSQSTASFPGLGTVVAPGDCIGIRISTDGSMSWIVDNSNYNRRYGTVWTRGIPAEDVAKYKPKKSSVPFDARSLVKLTFDGYYGGQLHFSWTEFEGREKSTQKFIFDFGGPTMVGIKGKNFQAIKADNLGFTYKWVKF